MPYLRLVVHYMLTLAIYDMMREAEGGSVRIMSSHQVVW